MALTGVGGTDLMIVYEYGPGGRVYLTPVPEPGSTLAVLAGAVAVGAGWRRLRRRGRPQHITAGEAVRELV